MSINFLRGLALTIQQQLTHAPINSPQWHSLRNQLLTVQAQLGQAKGGVQALTF